MIRSTRGRSIILAILIISISGAFGYLTGRYPKILHNRLGIEPTRVSILLSDQRLLPTVIQARLAQLLQIQIELSTKPLDLAWSDMNQHYDLILAEISDLQSLPQKTHSSNQEGLNQLFEAAISADFRQSQARTLAVLPVLWEIHQDQVQTYALAVFEDNSEKKETLFRIAQALLTESELVRKWVEATHISGTQQILEKENILEDLKPSALRKINLVK